MAPTLPPGEAIRKARSASIALGISHPHFLLIHARIRYVESETIGTMGIRADGQLTIAPSFVAGLRPDELAGCMAHEMLHPTMGHHERKGARDHETWNIACDMAINEALRRDGIKLPKGAFYPPQDYTGPLSAEELCVFIQRNPQSNPKNGQGQGQGQGQGNGQGSGNGSGQGRPMPGQGCGMEAAPASAGASGQGQGQGQAPGQGPGPNWKQIAIQARTMAQGIGRGTCGVAELLAPLPARVDWRSVIGFGFQMAHARPGRDYQTFSARHRRTPIAGPMFPGWRASDPKVALIIDVSGSMDRKWIARIIGESVKIAKLIPGARLFLATHTDECTWQGWIAGPGASDPTEALARATAFSGGTHATPAYEAVRAAGTFDTVIHFTDCEIETPWPENPGRKLIVGAFGPGAHRPYSALPPGAIHIPIEED